MATPNIIHFHMRTYGDIAEQDDHAASIALFREVAPKLISYPLFERHKRYSGHVTFSKLDVPPGIWTPTRGQGLDIGVADMRSKSC